MDMKEDGYISIWPELSMILLYHEHMSYLALVQHI